VQWCRTLPQPHGVECKACLQMLTFEATTIPTHQLAPLGWLLAGTSWDSAADKADSRPPSAYLCCRKAHKALSPRASPPSGFPGPVEPPDTQPVTQQQQQHRRCGGKGAGGGGRPPYAQPAERTTVQLPHHHTLSPAVSMCSQAGAAFANSCKNRAAVMDPAEPGSPVEPMSATLESSILR
jgi:hypothetical protein